MVGTLKQNASTKALPLASIGNSLLLLLPLAAALQFNVAFWVLVGTNFVLMHAIWIGQLLRGATWSSVNWGWRLSLWPLPLVAFGLLGTGSYFIWERQLTSVFPS